MDRIEMGEGRAFLIAVPEKALADKVYLDRGSGIRTQKMMSIYLEKDLRIEPAELIKLNPNTIEEIAQRYRSNKVRLLSHIVRRTKRGP